MLAIGRKVRRRLREEEFCFGLIGVQVGSQMENPQQAVVASGREEEHTCAVMLLRAGERRCDGKWEGKQVWIPTEDLEEGRVWL